MTADKGQTPSPGQADPVVGEDGRAACDVLAERDRQRAVEGWTPEHDDQHDREELAKAAACYVWPFGPSVPTTWPWDEKFWKPSDRRSNLVKAGALILAEIERLDRAENKGTV